MAPSFLLLQVITNEKTLKLMQIDRLPALPRFSPQKHVPTTLVGIPVDIYTLIERARFLMRPPVNLSTMVHIVKKYMLLCINYKPFYLIKLNNCNIIAVFHEWADGSTEKFKI